MLQCKILVVGKSVFCVLCGLMAGLIFPSLPIYSGDATSLSEDVPLWSILSPRRPSIPMTEGDTWSKSKIDHFIFDRLKSAGLSPSPDAQSTTLLRRLYFDLVGLPPTPEEIDSFLKRLGKNTLDEVIGEEADRLMKSYSFGERWGRHWLDVARFAESSGKEANITFPYAWRYRDYVIDCFNQDVPFNRFLIEQIAGDLLPYENAVERARLLNATGFLALGPKNLDEANSFQFAADVIDEQIDTVSRSIMAHSIACARCHDHKSDPYTMEDYYALAGIFASTKTYFGTFVSPANRLGGDPLPLPKIPGQGIYQKSIPAKRVKELKAELAALKQEEEDRTTAVWDAMKAGRDTSEIFKLQDALRIFWRSGGIEGQLEQVDDAGNALPLTMGVLDRDQMVDAPMLERGDIREPGSPVVRRLPEAIHLAHIHKIDSSQSGRLQLAEWLVHPSHPLTARVFVNRVWHHLMGAGLVRTLDDFGNTGQLPSDPELLDHLAFQLLDHDWSIKQLIRQIVLSRVYQQASTYNPKNFDQDPDNRFHWRASKRRLDAEAIRDSMLLASGELDKTPPRGSLVAQVIGDSPVSLIGLNPTIPYDLDGSLHRSVYLPVLRDRLPDVLAMFDFAEPSLVTGARDTTNVPVQALFLMNSSFVQARSAALAELIMQEIPVLSRSKTGSDPKRIQRIVETIFKRCLGREPDKKEIELATAYLASMSTGNRDEQKILASYCQAIFASAEFRNLD